MVTVCRLRSRGPREEDIDTVASEAGSSESDISDETIEMDTESDEDTDSQSSSPADSRGVDRIDQYLVVVVRGRRVSSSL